MPKRYNLAQLNISEMKFPLDSPGMADFVANLDRVNALADSFDGFVWRLQSEIGNNTDQRPMGDQVLVNMSVWRDVESLSRFVYDSGHIEIMRRRREWFVRASTASVVLWWIDEGHRPTIGEAGARLALLRQNGPSPAAFTFGQPFPAPQ